MFVKIDRLLSKISIQKKIIIIFLGSVLIPLFIQAFYNLTVTEQRLHKEMLQHLENVLSDRATQIILNLGDTVKVSLRYYNDERIYRWLDQEYSSDYDYLLTYQDEISPFIMDLSYHQQIEDVTFYTNNKSIFGGALVQYLENFNNLKLGESLIYYQDDFLDYEGGNLWLRSSVSAASSEVVEEQRVSVIRRLNYYPQYQQSQKLVKITLSSAFFNRVLADTELFDSFYLVDRADNILFSTKGYNKSGMYEKYQPSLLPRGVQVIEKEIDGYPLKICGFYDSKLISQQFLRGHIGTSISFLISLIFAAICITLVGLNLTNRTKQIVSQAREIAKGNFVVSESAKYARDEIGAVENSINDLSVQLKELIEKEYKGRLHHMQMESETNKAKFQALQSQVNPHFLFNALESIRLKAQSKNEIETATMIKYMSKMFRYIIDWTDEVVPLNEDIRFLEEFLAVQRYRFGVEFDYRIRVEDGLGDIKLPKMLIQPLVENACVHGLEAVAEERLVIVDIYRNEDKVVVQVEDNGGGISNDRLQEIYTQLESAAGKGRNVGLINVCQRLRLYYGEDAKMEITSQYGKGTICVLIIPLLITASEGGEAGEQEVFRDDC